MTLLRLPSILAAVMMLRGVDGSCVEDNCYGALYWNPAGAEECSDHFVTTVVPAPTTTTVTITSDVSELTLITGAPVVTGVIIPSQAIPTYIVRACYGDISYRFQSACSCIEAGPTTTMVAQPTVTDTVVFPITGGVVPPGPPVVSPEPLPPTLPASLSSGGLVEPTCVPIPGPVIVTVQVDTLYMTLTMAGSTLCIGNTTTPAGPSSAGSCSCPASAPALSSSSSSGPTAPTANSTTGFRTSSFSTVRRTSSFSGYTNTSSAAATSGPSASEEEEPTSTSVESTEASGTGSSAVEASTIPITSTEPSPSPSSVEQPSSTAAASSSAAEPSTSTPSSTLVPPTTTGGPSSSPSSSSQRAPTTTTPSTTAAAAGPTHFIPHGPVVLLQVASGPLAGQYITSDPPTDDRPTNLRSRTTPDIDAAAVWTLDAPTGILFQQVGGTGAADWWGAWFGFGARSQWGAVQLLPADTIASWLVAPVVSGRAPLRCVIDYTASNVVSCGQQLWTRLMQSDKCGWAITTPFNPTYAAACPGSEELFIQAVQVSPDEEGIN